MQWPKWALTFRFLDYYGQEQRAKPGFTEFAYGALLDRQDADLLSFIERNSKCSSQSTK